MSEELNNQLTLMNFVYKLFPYDVHWIELGKAQTCSVGAQCTVLFDSSKSTAVNVLKMYGNENLL